MLRRNPTSRRWLRLAAYVIVPALTAGGIQAIETSPAAAEISAATVPCPTVSGESATDSTSTSTTTSIRCIDGAWLTTRAKINDVCLKTLKAVTPAAEYGQAECGGSESREQIEFIVQTRGISRLDLSEGPVTLGISPKIQWEVYIPLGPPDLIRYNLDCQWPWRTAHGRPRNCPLTASRTARWWP